MGKWVLAAVYKRDLPDNEKAIWNLAYEVLTYVRA